jgi:hypothetical protein
MKNVSFNWKFIIFLVVGLGSSFGYIYWLYFYVFPFEFINQVGFEFFSKTLFEKNEPGIPKDFSLKLFENFDFSSVQYRWLQIFLMFFVLALTAALIVALSGSLLLGIVLLNFLIISSGFFYDGILFYNSNVYSILVLLVFFLICIQKEDHSRFNKVKNFYLGVLIGLLVWIKINSILVLSVFIIFAKWRGFIFSNDRKKGASIAFFVPIIGIFLLRVFLDPNLLNISSFLNLNKFFEGYPLFKNLFVVWFLHIYSPMIFVHFCIGFLGVWGIVEAFRNKVIDSNLVRDLKNIKYVSILGLAVFVEEFSKTAFSLLLPYIFILLALFLGISILRKDENFKKIIDSFLISCVIALLFLGFNGLDSKRQIWKDGITIQEISKFNKLWTEPIFTKIKLCDLSYLMNFLPQNNLCSGSLKIINRKLVYFPKNWHKIFFESKGEFPSIVFMGRQFPKFLPKTSELNLEDSLIKILTRNYVAVHFKVAIVWVRKDKPKLFTLVKRKTVENKFS